MNYNSLFSLMVQRRSIRDFSEPASKEQIEKIVKAASTAPSSFNTQPWKFVAIQDAGLKKKIASAYSAMRKKNNWYEQDSSFIERSTPVLVLCEDSSRAKIVSCSLAIENALLATESLGLGSLPIGAFSSTSEGQKELLEICGVKEGTLVLLCLFGKKNENPKEKQVKGIEEILEWK